MEIFVSLIIIVFGVLQIILFFKLWGMTNDVRELVEHFCRSRIADKQESRDSVSEYDKRLDTVEKGDYVIRLSDGKKMIVSNIKDDILICSVSLLSGVQSYRKNEVRYIDKG